MANPGSGDSPGSARPAAGAETQRLFVALPVPEVLKEHLTRAQAGLRGLLPPRAAAWVKPEAMHLTLRFLGNIPSDRIPELVRGLGDALAGSPRLALVAERLGCFPDLRYPRVIWVWVHDEGDPEAKGLKAVQRAVADASAPLTAEPPESRFQGHITLARVKQIRRPQADEIARFVEQAVSTRFGEWSADQVELIRSELTAAGSRYTRVAGWELGGGRG